MRSSSSRTASKPIRWIDWSIVVSGGSESADSGTLSNPTTERSSGTASPSVRATIDRLDRRRVVRREDRGRTFVALEEVAGGLGRGVGPVAADADEVGVERDAGRLERIAVAPLAQPRGLEVGASREEADPPVAELDQVLGRRRPRRLRLSESTVGSVEERTLWSTATSGRRRVTSTLLGVTRIEPSVSGADPRERALLPAGLVLAAAAVGEDDEVVAGAADRLCGALQQLGVERLDVRR